MTVDLPEKQPDIPPAASITHVCCDCGCAHKVGFTENPDTKAVELAFQHDSAKTEEVRSTDWPALINPTEDSEWKLTKTKS